MDGWMSLTMPSKYDFNSVLLDGILQKSKAIHIKLENTAVLIYWIWHVYDCKNFFSIMFSCFHHYKDPLEPFLLIAKQHRD